MYTHNLSSCTYADTPWFSLEGLITTGRVLRVVDGDTVILAMVPPGHSRPYKFRCRLDGINTPELPSREGWASRDHLVSLMIAEYSEPGHSSPPPPLSEDITRKADAEFWQEHVTFASVRCGEFDKYGRLLAVMMATPSSINERMVIDGYAEAYEP